MAKMLGLGKREAFCPRMYLHAGKVGCDEKQLPSVILCRDPHDGTCHFGALDCRCLGAQPHVEPQQTSDISVSLTTWKSLESVLGCLVSSTPAHVDVTYFGNTVLADVIKLRCHQQDGFLSQY